MLYKANDFQAFVWTSESTPSSQSKHADAQDNPRWQGYLASLTKNGYFKENIPGSAQYKELMTKASQAFMQTQAQQQSAGHTAAPAQSIATILQQPVQAELFKVILCTFGLCLLTTLAYHRSIPV